uniref:Uncharacterized protein n=1 Tax=Rhizophagus irregularis (strain DAOM 181602 / DAOM 197198 / MUCL 43194) TaxID=747089 RepID=U9US95_RHIID
MTIRFGVVPSNQFGAGSGSIFRTVPRVFQVQTSESAKIRIGSRTGLEPLCLELPHLYRIFEFYFLP